MMAGAVSLCWSELCKEEQSYPSLWLTENTWSSNVTLHQGKVMFIFSLHGEIGS